MTDIPHVDTEDADLFHTAHNICVRAALLLHMQAADEARRMLDAAEQLLEERGRYLPALRHRPRPEELQ